MPRWGSARRRCLPPVRWCWWPVGLSWRWSPPVWWSWRAGPGPVPGEGRGDGGGQRGAGRAEGGLVFAGVQDEGLVELVGHLGQAAHHRAGQCQGPQGQLGYRPDADPVPDLAGDQVSPVAQDDDVAVIGDEDVGEVSGPAGWVLAGPWCACWRGGGQSVVTSVTAARA